ncbi:MAG: PorV/PorQ family protein [Bacteroidia bacterium]
MKKLYISFALFSLVAGINPTLSFAGNEDRVGQAGGTELLINPWARSAGWAGANTSLVRGLEAQFLNVAGTSFTKKTEVVFARSNWLGNSGINLNAFGFSQGIGKDKTGTLSLTVMTMNFGDILVTTVNQPEGGIGTFRPNLTNIGFSYAKEFSNSIYGGVAIRTINQSISDVKASGICFDAGVQYITGKTENIRFGISLRNVGPRMKFSGDGLSFKGTNPETGASLTVEQRSETFEMPSLLNIGGAYVFNKIENHEITIAANFTSNSFSKDQVQGGVEYAFKKMFMVRAGYMSEISSTGNDSEDLSVTGKTNAFTGPTAGFTIQAPLNKKGSTFSIDYAYRATNPFNGVHTVGARINL